MDLLGTELIALPLVVGVVAAGRRCSLGFGWLAWRRGSLGAAAAGGRVRRWCSRPRWRGSRMALIGAGPPGHVLARRAVWAQLAAYASAIAAALVRAATSASGIDPTGCAPPSGWCSSLIGAAIGLVAPGGIIFFLFPPLLVLLGALAGRWRAEAERLAALARGAVLYLTLGAMLALLEELLSRGPMWLFAPLGALILLPALIEAKPLLDALTGAARWSARRAYALAGWAAAAAVPAYSADKQQQFTIEHVADGQRARIGR